MDKEKIVNTEDTEKEKSGEGLTSAEKEDTSDKGKGAKTDNDEGEETSKEESIEDKLATAEARIAELEKERLYKQAEFDNYRKRIIKEKTELILNGGRKVLENKLPVIDELESDFLLGEEAEDVEAETT